MRAAAFAFIFCASAVSARLSIPPREAPRPGTSPPPQPQLPPDAPETRDSAVVMTNSNTTSSSDPAHYPSSQTALLFLDYQNVLVNMIPDPARRQTLIDSANAILAAARKNNAPIVHCLVNTTADPPILNKVYEQWITVHKPGLEAMPELAAEYPDFRPSNSTDDKGHESISLRPPGYRSAFANLDLLPLLRETLGVTHLVIGGIATSGAVLGTAVQGTDLDFVVSIVEDAVWDPSEPLHRALIDTAFPSLAWVATTEQAVGYLSKECD